MEILLPVVISALTPCQIIRKISPFDSQTHTYWNITFIIGPLGSIYRNAHTLLKLMDKVWNVSLQYLHSQPL